MEHRGVVEQRVLEKKSFGRKYGIDLHRRGGGSRTATRGFTVHNHINRGSYLQMMMLLLLSSVNVWHVNQAPM